MENPGQSHLYSGNASFIEALYETYLIDQNAVSLKWREYFDRLRESEVKPNADQPHFKVRAEFRHAAQQQDYSQSNKILPNKARPMDDKQVSVLQLINSYRFLGHRQAELDPLVQHERPSVKELELEYHSLSSTDMSLIFNTGSLQGVPAHASLREIINDLSTTYCGTIGSEYMHLTDTQQKRWIQERLETAHGNPPDSPTKKLRVLDRLIAANGLETYLHRKYVGQKRFSLEGGDSLIPLLDTLIERCGQHKVEEFIVGMAHRGRLNVLVNIFGKGARELFDEFEGVPKPGFGSGDVKYHKGFAADLVTDNGSIHAILAFNPSHLEIISPVVEGSVRARQERQNDIKRNTILPILIHGDAAFAGQGVVMETLNLSQTRGYSTGGTLHIVINNQIGFTTSDPLDSRSTLYCTDVAKMVQAPIFHVNGDDPEAVVFVAEMVLDYRMRFNKDVVVDMVCYRRHGHNESDEPLVTQPIMYQCIKDHPIVKDIYARQLVKEGVIGQHELEALESAFNEKLKANLPVSKRTKGHPNKKFLVDYSEYARTRWNVVANTAITKDSIQRLTASMTHVPEHFKLHRSIERLLDQRRRMGAGELPIDWGFAEMLAYASLLDDGYPVRLSGQDSVRGTFFHRHAGIHDQNSGEIYISLQHLHEDQPHYLPINSLLSEAAVLGFEWGYSSSNPNSLVIWEAQFGDFVNNAQVIIDQFISSSEAKWERYCGLVLFLPHGYEGQGPEHSSARLERFLQLCAEQNIQVCVPSTPAQMFHMLRRQMLRPYRKPLIVMTPKSLLRHKMSTSTIDELVQGGFQPVIDEIDNVIKRKEVTRLVLCSGKVYYDLLEARRKHKVQHVAIVRIEQQYPFPKEELNAVLCQYPNAQDIVWTQEEPRNQGAWYYMQSRRHLLACLSPNHRLKYAGRRYFASPAVGYLQKHRQQQKALVDEALELDIEPVKKEKPKVYAN